MIRQIEKTVLINALAPAVWANLTNPHLMKKWMGEPEMEIEIITDWEVGNSIIITGFHHSKFENKGIVLQVEPYNVLQYSHLSSSSGLVDRTENYSVITFYLTPAKRQTLLTLKVQNFPTETIFKHLEFYWKTTTEILKGKIENAEVF